MIIKLRVIFFLLVLLLELEGFDRCLPLSDGPTWNRTSHYNNQPLSLQIEVTNRASHRIISHIAKILLQERIGYPNVNLFERPWDEPSDVVGRLRCEDAFCTQMPQAHINLEVWMPPGFGVDDNRVIDCGALGAVGRKGIFAHTDLVEWFFKRHKASLDHWRLFKDGHWLTSTKPPTWFNRRNWSQLNSSHCTNATNCLFVLSDKNGISNPSKFLDSLPPSATLLLGSTAELESAATYLTNSTPDDAHLFLLNWFPNSVTVRGRFSRIAFPDCQGGEIDQLKTACDFEVNQLTKVVWANLKEAAPLAFDMVKKFYISQATLIDLLKKVDVENDENPNPQYREIACEWVRNNRQIWQKWTLGWNVKDKLVIGAMVALYGKWYLAKDMIVKAMNDSVARLNNDKNKFNGSQYELQVDIRNVSCAKEVVLQDYMMQIQNKSGHNRTLIGLIAALCSDTIEPMLMLTNLERRLVISPTVESTRFLDYRPYRYFFRTIPSMSMLNALLVNVFIKYGWKRVVIMRKDDYFIDQEVFKKNDIEVLDDFEKDESKLTYDIVFKHLQKMKTLNGRIFIVEYFGRGTSIIMCAAYKLGMILDNGFVWFLNPWLVRNWWNLDGLECNSTHIKNTTSGTFSLGHREDDADPEDRVPTVRKTPYDSYSQYTYDAILVMGNAIWQLLQTNPSALSALWSSNISESYRNLIAETHFPETPQDKTIRFNDENERISGTWVLHQNQMGMKQPVNMWKIEGLPNGVPQIRNDTKGILVSWGASKYKPPLDGRPDSDCMVEGIRSMFGWTCINAIVFVFMMSSSALVILLIVVFVYYYKKKVSEAENRTKRPYDELCTELSDLDMPSSSIVLNRRVGQGAFGLVYGGEAKRNNRWEAVAVKVINNNATYEGKIEFLSEARLMRDLKHSNVVQLIGICLHPQEDVIYLVMEFMLFGDLKTYLLSRRVLAQQDPNHEDICPTLLTQFAVHIAEGVSYLHSKMLIHRDIACRNCLVGPGKVVKIGDFGLTRPMTSNKADGYYRFTRNCELPIRWMSPEAVQFGVFSVQSDIWSYGIVLYEIITFGVFPYDGLCDIEVVERVKRKDLSIVDCLPPSARNSAVCQLVEYCCAYNRDKRPSNMGIVLEHFQSRQNCVQPFLTDEPPKPNINNLNALPFQPGAGECIMMNNLQQPMTRATPTGDITSNFVGGPPGMSGGPISAGVGGAGGSSGGRLRSSGRGGQGKAWGSSGGPLCSNVLADGGTTRRTQQQQAWPYQNMEPPTVLRGTSTVERGPAGYCQPAGGGRWAERSLSTEYLPIANIEKHEEVSTISAPGAGDIDMDLDAGKLTYVNRNLHNQSQAPGVASSRRSSYTTQNAYQEPSHRRSTGAVAGSINGCLTTFTTPEEKQPFLPSSPVAMVGYNTGRGGNSDMVV